MVHRAFIVLVLIIPSQLSRSASDHDIIPYEYVDDGITYISIAFVRFVLCELVFSDSSVASCSLIFVCSICLHCSLPDICMFQFRELSLL